MAAKAPIIVLASKLASKIIAIPRAMVSAASQVRIAILSPTRLPKMAAKIGAVAMMAKVSATVVCFKANMKPRLLMAQQSAPAGSAQPRRFTSDVRSCRLVRISHAQTAMDKSRARQKTVVQRSLWISLNRVASGERITAPSAVRANPIQ